MVYHYNIGMLNHFLPEAFILYNSGLDLAIEFSFPRAGTWIVGSEKMPLVFCSPGS